MKAPGILFPHAKASAPILLVAGVALVIFAPMLFNAILHPAQESSFTTPSFLGLVSAGLFFYHARLLSWNFSVRVSGYAVAMLAFGASGYIIGRSQSVELLEQGSGILLLAGCIGTLGGSAALGKLRFPLLFLLFALPYPGWLIDSITLPLKIMISECAEWALYAHGYPVARDGVIISLGPYRLLVADACTGLHSILFLCALGSLYLHMTAPRKCTHALILAVLLVPLALFANFVRVMTLLLTTYHLGDAAGQSYWHDLAGILLFGSAFSALFLLDLLLERIFGSRQRTGNKTGTVRIRTKLPWHKCIFLVTLLLATIGLSHALKPAVRSTTQTPSTTLEATFPLQIGDWKQNRQAGTVIVSPEVKASVARLYAETLERIYTNSHGEQIMLSVAYGSHQQGNTLQAHRPEFCYQAQGFVLLNAANEDVRLTDSMFEVRRLLVQNRDRFESVTYWMTVGSSPVLPGLTRKIAQIRHGLSGEIPDGMIVRISSLGRNSDHAFATHQAFMKDLQQTLPGQIGLPAPGTDTGREPQTVAARWPGT